MPYDCFPLVSHPYVQICAIVLLSIIVLLNVGIYLYERKRDKGGIRIKPVETLTDICDAYWDSVLEEPHGSIKEPVSPSLGREYRRAINQLVKRGPEILDWVITRLRHPNYDARETTAWLAGELGSRNQLGEKHRVVIDELNWLATRLPEEDIKEAQANASAVLALGKVGDRQGIVALRHILTTPEWEGDDLQWDAADVLGQLVGESFVDSEDRVEAAKEWLRANPSDAAQHMLELTA